MNPSTAPFSAAPAADRGAVLARARLTAGVVLPDLSRKTEYGIPFLLRVENGTAEIDVETYEAISRAIDELVAERSERA
jgi:hypothetical protein